MWEDLGLGTHGTGALSIWMDIRKPSRARGELLAEKYHAPDLRGLEQELARWPEARPVVAMVRYSLTGGRQRDPYAP